MLLAGAASVGLFLVTLAMAFPGAMKAIDEPGSAGLSLGGLLVALPGAPFLIWTTVLKDRRARLDQEGHMTDRISKAVEHLGAEKTVKVRGTDAEGKAVTVEETRPYLEVRIGAILSLERIAQDSTLHDKGRDHVRVMEILCAYIRHNAPASGARDFALRDWEPLKDDPTLEGRAADETRRTARFGGELFFKSNAWQWAQTLKPPRADIAEALKVAGSRNRDQLLVEAAWPHPRDGSTTWPFDNAPHLPVPPGEGAVNLAVLADFKADAVPRSGVAGADRHRDIRRGPA